MIRKILLALVLLLSVGTMPVYSALAANNSYGLTDYQYTQGLYSVERLKVNNECMKPTYDAYGQGKASVEKYNAEKDRCFVKSFEIIPKEKPASSSLQEVAEKGKIYGACMTECVGDPKQYKGDYGLMSAARNRCSDKCSASRQTTSSVKTTVPDSTPEALSAGGKKYQERYVAKCMDAYKNNSGATACCKALAEEDANKMQKRGVFDTPTTAEIPIMVDDLKCKPVEYKYECTGGSGTAEKDACKRYMNQCMEMGMNLSMSEETRKVLCEIGYNRKDPLELNRVDKHLLICLGSEKITDEDEMFSKTGKCIGEGSRALSDYVNRCIISANGGRFSRWFIWFRTLFSKAEKAKYESQKQECLKSYDAELDKKLAG